MRPKLDSASTIPTSNKAIFVNDGGDFQFTLSVTENLKKIASRPCGSALLQDLVQLSRRGTTVTISPSPSQSRTRPLNPDAAVALKSFLRKKPGPGSSVEVQFKPTEAVHLDDQGRPSTAFEPNESQAFVTLAHELIHAKHIMSGTFKPHSDKEELRAVGLGKYKDEPVTENKVRAEHDLPIRTAY